MKRWFKTVLLVVLLTGIVLSLGYAGYRGYRHTRQVRLVKQARNYLAKFQDRQALLCVQRALSIDDRDLAATRLMAEIASKPPVSPAALLWQKRVADLNPNSTEDRLTLAKTALLLRDFRTATNALQGIDIVGKQTWSYHNIAGTVAASANLREEAEAHFVEAVRLEPGNLVSQLNLAVVRLQNTNALTRGEARKLLELICENPTNSSMRCQALRELIGDRSRNQDAAAALQLADRLLQEKDAEFSDRMLRIHLLKQTSHPEFNTAISAARDEAATNAAKVVQLASWELANTSPDQALRFLQTLPLEIATNASVALVTAECYERARDYAGLQKLLEGHYWEDLEFLRHAYLARAQRGQDLVNASKAEWDLALRSATTRQASLTMLLQLAAGWHWAAESEEILWTIVNNFPSEKWAVQSLASALYAAGRTRPLMMLFSQQLKRSPNDLLLKNNLAASALLLDAQELKPHQLAREVYEAQPSNPSFASTYAFSLYLQEKRSEALKVMQSLSSKDLENPVIAGYYGIILQANGNVEKARSYLSVASAGTVLPEERKLFSAKGGG